MTAHAIMATGREGAGAPPTALCACGQKLTSDSISGLAALIGNHVLGIDEHPLCKHCKEPVVDEGDEVYTHLDGDPWCDADEWARAGEEAEGADAAEYYDGTYAEVDLPCPHDSDGQHFVGCGCDD